MQTPAAWSFSFSHLASLTWLAVTRRRLDSGWKAKMVLLMYLALHLGWLQFILGCIGWFQSDRHFFLSMGSRLRSNWVSFYDDSREEVEAPRLLRVRPSRGVASLLQHSIG